MNERERIRKYFDDNVEDYEHKHYEHTERSFMTVRLERVLRYVDQLSLPRGSEVLDAGCGPGYILEELAVRGFKVHGIDASQAMIESARQRVVASGPMFPPVLEVADIEKLPFPHDKFDLVCSTGVIEYLNDDLQVLKEFRRVLKPGGHLVLPVTNRWSPVLYFDFLIEALKSASVLREAFNRIWVAFGNRPVLKRGFHIRRHRPSKFREELAAAGFEIVEDGYFHFMPWPRPINLLLPGLTSRIGSRMESWDTGPLKWCGEGYLVLCTKPS